MKVVHVGLPKTGTCSLSKALKNLGLKIEWNPALTNREKRITWLRNNDAIVDTFASAYFEEYDEAFDCKFILTIRNPEDWHKSIKKWWDKNLGNHSRPELKPTIEKILAVNYDEDLFTKCYTDHINAITEYFKDRREDLLIIDIDNVSSDTNTILYDFLSPHFLNLVKVEGNYPHENRSI